MVPLVSLHFSEISQNSETCRGFARPGCKATKKVILKMEG
jgi:hypothetical protein